MTKNAAAILAETLAERNTDPFKVGDVVRWTASSNFTYAALKTPAGWFTTARTGNVYVDSRLEDYEELVEILSRSEVTDIVVSAEWEEVTV